MRFLFWALAFFSVASFTLIGIAAADTWWHLAAGREIVKQGALLSTDPFSFTAGEAFWFNHEWLVEIIFYLCVKFAGLNGLYALRTLMVFLAFALVPALGHKHRGVLVALLPVTAMSLGQAGVFLDARAYLVTYLFLSLTILFIRRFLESGSKKWLYAGILIMIPWANCHGAYLLGTVTWGMAFVAELSQRRATWKPLLATWTTGLLVCAVNPYTFHIWLFPFSLWEHPVYKLHLNEWQRPDLLGVNAPYLLLVALGLGLLYRGKASRWEWLMSVAYMGLGFLGWRHCTLAALVLIHTVPKGLPEFEGTWKRQTQMALFLLPLCGFLYLFGQRVQGGARALTLTDSHFCSNVVQVLQQSPELPRRIMNPYEWGGYLSWEVGPDFLIFIDGRAHTLFPDQTYLDSIILQFGGTYHEIPELVKKSREQILLDYDAQLVLATKIQGRQYEWMTNQSDWVLLFEDHISALYLKDSSKTITAVSAATSSVARAMLYASRFQGRAAERVFLERALELSKDGEEKAAIEALLKERF